MKRLAAITTRVAAWLVAVCVVVSVALAGAAWYLLPRLGDYKPQVEGLLSDYLGQQISITRLDADWQGLNVTLRASGVRVAVGDHPGSGMRFGEMYLSFHPLSVFEKGRTFERLELRGPTIEAARLADGRFRVGDTIIGTPRGTLRRLLQGRNLVITDGTLVWRDALAPGDGLRIENVDVAIRSQDEQRRFEFAASPPAAMVQRIRGGGSYDPESLGAGAWTATVNASVGRLDVARIPPVLQEQLPWQSRGSVDAGIRIEWQRGTLTAASAEVTAEDFVIPYAKDKPPLSATRFSSALSWRRSEQEWRLVFTEPEIVLDATPVSVSRFELERRDELRTYSARDVNLQDLLGVVDKLEIELPWQELINDLEPRGSFARAALTLTGPYLEAREWRFEGAFQDVGWQAQRSYPGVQGLDGSLAVDADRGELALASEGLALDAPETLRGKVAFDRVAGNVEWFRWGGDWAVDVSDGEVANEDLHLTDLDFYTRVEAGAEGESPYVLARMRVPRADVKALGAYLPAKRMTPKQVEWLDRALAGGRISRGRFYLNGPLNAFPFEDGQGELEASARIRGGVLDFHEKWPDLEGLEGVLELDNARFEARVRAGSMMSSPITRARVWSDDFFRRNRSLYIQGEMAAKADDVVQFLRRGPLNKNPPPAYSTMAAQGAGRLSLMIELPFTRLKEASRVQGDYDFQDVAVEVADGIEFTGMAGRVRFTEGSVQGEGITGQLLGGTVEAEVSTVEPGRPMTFAISGSGSTEVSRLSAVMGQVMTSRLEGEARWNARFVGGPGTNRLDVSSDLQGVEIQLPDPLWKPADSVAGIDVHVELERHRRRIDLDLADRLTGALRYVREEDGRPVLERGVLNLGGGAELPENGLTVAVRGPEVDVDQWIAEIIDLRQYRERVAGDNPDRDVLFEHLRVLNIDVDNFRYMHRDLGPVSIKATSPDNRDWRARIDGARLAGTARMQLGREPARYVFDMTRLHWPRLEKGERATTYKTPPDPSEFAHLSIDAQEFRFGDMRLGRLEFRAGPEGSAWLIRRLSLEQPELGIEATGQWTSDQFDAHRTSVRVTARAANMGKALGQLGLEGQVAKGSAELEADLSWSGEPGDFALGALNGELSFNADDGRFLKLEPGSGRLLGLFNIETLVRRFRLDFTDVFKEGFAFDRIHGEAGITAGRLQTDGIFVISPAALLEMEGSMHLGDETYDLEVTVAPQVGANLSLAGALANPAAGAILFVVQKLFKKQMAKLIHYKYRVTGAWTDPQVDSIRPESSAPGAPGLEGGRNP